MNNTWDQLITEVKIREYRNAEIRRIMGVEDTNTEVIKRSQLKWFGFRVVWMILVFQELDIVENCRKFAKKAKSGYKKNECNL